MNQELLKRMQEEVFSETQSLIDEFGPRLAGTESDLKASDKLYDMMSKTFDEAHQESFYVYKNAFLGWIRILVASYLLAVIFIWLKLYMISFSILLISLLVLLFNSSYIFHFWINYTLKKKLKMYTESLSQKVK